MKHLGSAPHQRGHLLVNSATRGSGGDDSGSSSSSGSSTVQQLGRAVPIASIGRSASRPADMPAAADAESEAAQPWIPLVITAAVGIVICYADRSNMSTAILPMAEAFHWDKTFQGVVLSAFFAGYAATQVLGGSLADRYGGKFVLTAGVALWSLFTVITPAAAAGGTAQLLAVRVLLGVGEGVAFPAIHSIIARNVPKAKRSTAVGVITAASYAGTALAFGLSPWLISNFSWQMVFYLFGGSALLWLPFWLPLHVRSKLDGELAAGSSRVGIAAWQQQQQQEQNSPLAGSAGGSGEDLPLLLQQQQQQLQRDSFELEAGRAADDAAGFPAPPAAAAAAAAGSNGTGFMALLQCREVWAICVCQYAQAYAMYGLLSWLPTFFSDYGVKVSDLGGYTLLPYLLQGAVGLGAGALADSLITSRGWSVRSVRIGLQLAGMLGPAACLMAAVSPVVGPSPEVASALITAGLGLSALSLGGVSVNHLDIAPRHAGMVFGAGNTAATLAGLVSVPLTGLLLDRTGSWLLVFSLIGAHFVVGSAVWVAWVGDKPLPEDGPDDASSGGPLAPAAAPAASP